MRTLLSVVFAFCIGCFCQTSASADVISVSLSGVITSAVDQAYPGGPSLSDTSGLIGQNFSASFTFDPTNNFVTSAVVYGATLVPFSYPYSDYSNVTTGADFYASAGEEADFGFETAGSVSVLGIGSFPLTGNYSIDISGYQTSGSYFFESEVEYFSVSASLNTLSVSAPTISSGVPETATWLMFIIGFAGVAAMTARSRHFLTQRPRYHRFRWSLAALV